MEPPSDPWEPRVGNRPRPPGPLFMSNHSSDGPGAWKTMGDGYASATPFGASIGDVLTIPGLPCRPASPSPRLVISMKLRS